MVVIGEIKLQKNVKNEKLQVYLEIVQETKNRYVKILPDYAHFIVKLEIVYSATGLQTELCF